MNAAIKKNLLIAVWMTVITTLLLGVAYPLVVTAIAQVLFPEQANGQLIVRTGRVVGSRILGQPFTGDAYFHSRPSAAGSGYDAANSGGSNLGPTNATLVRRIAQQTDAEQVQNKRVPIDLVTTSASGLDPHITPAAAEYQVERVARARHAEVGKVRALVQEHTEGRQLGFLGEPRVNVLELNLDLDRTFPRP